MKNLKTVLCIDAWFNFNRKVKSDVFHTVGKNIYYNVWDNIERNVFNHVKVGVRDKAQRNTPNNVTQRTL